jgi:hypothetical protein
VSFTLKKSIFPRGVHVVIHGKDHVPFGQGIHEDEFVPPEKIENVLGGQEKQVDDPALFVYVPAGH